MLLMKHRGLPLDQTFSLGMNQQKTAHREEDINTNANHVSFILNSMTHLFAESINLACSDVFEEV